jgi:hypothetical protein
MSRLAILSLAFGVVLGSVYVGMIVVPGKMRNVFKAFPRARAIGWVFSALALSWAAWHLNNMTLGKFDEHKDLLFIITPVVFTLVVICMDELLAARSLGAIMILLPTPLLEAARVSDAPWSLLLVIKLIAYAMAIKGIFIVFSPYLFRQWVDRIITSDERCRLFGVVGCTLMLIVIALALTVY